MSTYGYIRTSLDQRDTQHGMDPDTQRRPLLAYGVPAENIYADIGVSGYKAGTRRTAWHALNRKLKAGDTLVVWELSRLTRRWIDHDRLILNLKDRGVRLVSLAPDEAFLAYIYADPDTPEALVGAILTQVYAWRNQQEVSRLIYRIKAGQDRAVASGKRIGRPPTAIVSDSMLSAKRAQGKSLTRISKDTGLSRSTVRRRLAKIEGTMP